MLTTATINVQELLQVADAVSKERSVERAVVMEALEEVIARSAKARYGVDFDIRASIDPKTGEITIKRYREVMEEPEIAACHLSLEEARTRNPEAQYGEFIVDDLPPIEIGRISAQSARQVITQKIREAERERQYEEFKDRVGDIVHGSVKRVEFGNVIVDLGAAEGIVRRSECIPRETFNQGDRIRCYLYDVRRENSGSQIFLSRTHPQFLVKLFTGEVPEIYDGLIEIKAAVRDPGSKAKMAVWCEDPSLDPIGSCVGMRGTRVQAVTNELQGERVDIIEWSPDIVTMVINLFAPTQVLRVVVDDDLNKIEVVVPDGTLSQVIGRRGQNVRLAAQMIGWDIDVRTEQEDSEKRQRDLTERTQLFMKALDVDQLFAQFLASEGLNSVEEIAETPPETFASLEGMDETIAEELQKRAAVYLEKTKLEKLEAIGFSKDLLEFEGVTPDIGLRLGEGGVKTLEDMAGLTPDEITGDEENTGILDQHPSVTADIASEWIMAARKKAGWI